MVIAYSHKKEIINREKLRIYINVQKKGGGGEGKA
jgi:hypothetical protein